MKRFISTALAIAILMTSADFGVFDLSPITAYAASAVTDAYDAYQELRDNPFSHLTDEVNSKRDPRGDAEQNPEPNRYNVIFGPVEGGIPQTSWGLKPAGISTSGTYGVPAKFNQTGIDGTAQVKSGEWLNETTYDATAGTPTTENMFVTVGGTQYLVDIDYEYIYRPYIRRYHFSASTPNYRYYSIDDNKDYWTEDMYREPWTGNATTDWEHNLATNDGVENALDKSVLTMYGDDLRDRNIAYVASSIGARVKDLNHLDQSEVLPYVGRGTKGDQRRAAVGAGTDNQGLFWTWDQSEFPEEEYKIDDWYNCGWEEDPNTDTYSPGMAAAIMFKKQIALAILELKSQYLSIDDNYRADQGAVNVDKETTEVMDWYLEDKVSWMFTYYAMVRNDAHGDGVVDTYGEAKDDFPVGNYSTYESKNVWAPIVTSYYFDYDGYGIAGQNVDELASKQDSDTYVAQPLSKNVATSNYRAPVLFAVDKALAYKLHESTDAESSYVPVLYEQAPTYYGIFVQHHLGQYWNANCMPPDSDLSNYSWYNTLNLYVDAYKNTENYGISEVGSVSFDRNAFLNCWLCYVSSTQCMLSIEGGDFTTELGPNELGSAASSYYPNATNYWNQLTDVYRAAVNDLFVSVSGLFYQDEIEELFGGEYCFPGVNESAKSDWDNHAMDQCVAQNLYFLFGVPMLSSEYYTTAFEYNKSWSIPWACFPVGGDLDGGMEDRWLGKSNPNGDNPRVMSTQTDPAFPITTYELFTPMMICPQYVKYTKFSFHVKATMQNDSAHWNDGYYHWYTYHKECQDGHSHLTNQDTICEIAKNQSQSGYGPHNCHYCSSTDGKTGDGPGHYTGDSTSCGTYGHNDGCGWGSPDPITGDKDWDDEEPCYAGQHSHSSSCTGVCDTHWHSADRERTNQGAAADHGTRHYDESIEVEAYKKPLLYVGNDDAVTGSGDSTTWTEQYKNLSYNETIAQTFRNVRYLNIVSYSIWNYDRAEVRGLGHLLAKPVDNVTITNSSDASEELIVTDALSSMGYSAYDIDEKDINNSPGLDGITGAVTYWNNLEIKGRVANSFHEDSLGNQQEPFRKSLTSATDTSGYSDKFNILREITFINTSDTPALNYYKTASPYNMVRCVGYTPSPSTLVTEAFYYKNFVNGDREAFRLLDTVQRSYSDDLYFNYNPLSQGGRSHSTFGGFVAQALAHTLYSYIPYPHIAEYWRVGGVSNVGSPKLAYSNSLRIQGDYLAVRDLQGNTTTIVGSMYDTWDERQGLANNGLVPSILDGNDLVNKYNILETSWPDREIPLAQYLTADAWVMGSFAYILSRVPYEVESVSTPFASGGDIGCVMPGSGLKSLTDCWMIHTYCRGINGWYKSPWDGYVDSWGLTIACGYGSGTTSASLKSYGQLHEINPWATDCPRGQAINDYAVYPDMTNVLGEDLHLRNSLNELDRPKFQLPDGTWSTEVILTYEEEGNNAGQDFVNWSNQRTPNLVTNTANPLQYIGYQSEGDGTKNIITTGDGTTTQTGFTDSDVGKAFNADKTMITSTDTAVVGAAHFGKGTYRDEGGFQRFGITTCTPAGNTVYDKARYIVYNEEWNEGNNRDPYDDGSGTDSEKFSRWYPWLADINVSRYLPNGRYFSSQIYNVYKLAARHADGGGAGGPYDYNRVPYGTDEVRINTHYKRSGAGGGGTDSETLPNSIVVYNPATTFTAHLVGPSDYLPDATNYGIASTGGRRYLAGYGDGAGKLVLRDQRVGRHQNYGSQGQEDYHSQDGVVTVTGTQSSTSYHYEMRYHDVATKNFQYYESKIDTKAYTMEDYDVNTTKKEVIDLTTTTEGRYHTFEENTTLKMITKSASGKYHAATVNVEPGDTITWEDSAAILTRGSDNFSLEYKAFQDAFEQMQLNEGISEDDLFNTVDYIPITAGTVINPINATFQMRAGSVIELSIPITDDSGNPMELPFEMTLPDKFSWKHTTDGIYHIFYIEANEDAILSSVNLKALTNFRIQSYTGSAISAHDILLMSVGIGNGETQVPVEDATTLNYYYESMNYSVNTTERWGSYNSTVVDISGSYEFLGVDISVFEVNHLYIQDQNGTITVSLDQSDPHKVPNTNWRYYVLGWKTEFGDYITSVYDPALDPDSTVRLIPPIGATDDNYLNATILDNMAMHDQLGVARYGNNFYLTELAGAVGGDQYDYTLDWYGMKVTEFDTISFGEETTKTYGTLVSWEQTSTTNKTLVYQKSYELVFRCSWGKITKVTEITQGMYSGCTREIRAYDVKYSGNIEHKISMELDVAQDDWVRVADIVNDTVINNLKDASGDYLSLDDEFTLYWDNTVDLAEHNVSNEVRNLSTVLGRGWDVVSDDKEDVAGLTEALKNNGSGLFANIWGGSPGSTVTDTTKWIYSKYVTFNVDMYGFTEGTAYTLLPSYDPKNPHAGDSGSESARQFDPTTPAYNGSSYNNLVYIPAGTPVHLGYYTSSGDDDGDNDGQFIDYGYQNGATKDPNGDFYVYHFWCPLSNGESDSNVVAEFHVTTINNGDTGAGNQASWSISGTSRYLRTPAAFAGLDVARDDEWGNDILKVGATNNEDNLSQISVSLTNNGTDDVAVHVVKEKNIYTRYNDSYNTETMSVAGRIGGLTVVDSGDPRYQDSFKNPTNMSEYAITPIVLAVKEYSNTETIGAPGSQRRYLTDNSDVRGRLWLMPTTTSEIYNLKDDFNTYGTQWFKRITERYKLPMGADFNVHADSELPEQRLGYELYCSLETIGNYYGSAGWRLDAGEDPSNLNDDYGQTKVQIRPFYVYIDSSGNATPLDVYMRRNGNYVLLNAGSQYSSASENTALGGHDAGPYWVDASHSAYYAMSIKSNTNGDWNNTVERTYRLDQTLLRRMVTKREAETTYYVMKTDKELTNNPAVKKGITETLLEPFKLDSSAEADLLDYNYYYGNTQVEFLREQNRTFVGGVNNYIGDSKEVNWTNRAKRYGQKWHFGLGLPSSAIFVKHGSTQFNSETIINGKEGVILVLVDVYAVGEKWVLHYQSEISDEGLIIDGHPVSADTWKVYPDQYPNLIPVSMYRADQLAPNDIEDRGTY